MEIKVSKSQYLFLISILELDWSDLIKLLNIRTRGVIVYIEFPEELVEKVREYLYDKAIEIGLEINGNMNANGLILEEFADKLYKEEE
jgi:hypothetical protein